MSRPLRVLITEDSSRDAELVVEELCRAGFDPNWKLVDTEAAYVASLRPDLDVILSDYSMPEFSALHALKLLKESGLDIPFIIVSGTIGEDTAVAAMKQGAVDYLLKDRLTRLGSAVGQAIEQCKLRQERKKTERALRESEERFREVVQNIEDVFWMTNFEKTEMLFVSLAYEKIWGRTCVSLYAEPMTWLDAIHPDDRDRVRDSAGTKQFDGTYREEYRIVRPDGSIRWIDDRAFPVRNRDGTIHRIAGVARDITERKQAEQHLRERESMLANAQRIGRMGSWNIDVRTGHLAWSEATCDLFGIAPDEFAESFDDFYRFILPEDRARCSAEQGCVSPARPTIEAEYRIQRSDGEIRWMYERGNVEFDAAGNQMRRLGMVMDITERKQVEERVREQARMLDHAHEAIFVRDFQSKRITFWNCGAERLYGLRASEVLGRDMDDLIFGDSNIRTAVDEQLLRAGVWQGEHHHVFKSGKKLIVSSSATLIRDAIGNPKSTLLIHFNITDQKNLEAQFLRAQRMDSIGTLAGGIAHDLNNVLSPIILSLDLLNRKFTDAQSRKLISTISASAQRGASMVNQVLSFARGVEGQRVTLQLKHVIGDIEKIANDTFLKQIQVRTIVLHDLWTILADPTQLHQVLLNLCVNARDAMPNGGQLIISAENLIVDAHYAGLNLEARPGPYIRIQVEDTGTGMPAEIIAKIFDPFFTTKEVGKGTGLGLSTTLAIVKSHRGFIEVCSESGRGTKFKVYFPANGNDSEDAQREAAAEMPRGNGELILLIDDEATVREITGQTLEAFGYHVVIASDGAEAMAVFAGNSAAIAAVLTDITMPIMDGLAAIQVLRRMNSQIPIIAASGLANGPYTAQLNSLGVKHVLPKPYTAETLLKTLRQVLAEEF